MRVLAMPNWRVGDWEGARYCMFWVNGAALLLLVLRPIVPVCAKRRARLPSAAFPVVFIAWMSYT